MWVNSQVCQSSIDRILWLVSNSIRRVGITIKLGLCISSIHLRPIRALKPNSILPTALFLLKLVLVELNTQLICSVVIILFCENLIGIYRLWVEHET